MKKGIKRLILAVTAIICLLGSVYFSVWKFSAENMSNRNQNRQEIVLSAESLAWSEGHWHAVDGSYTVLDEAATVGVSFETPVYLHNLLLDIDLPENVSELQIRYAAEKDKPFFEWETLTLPITVQNDDVYLVVGREVAELELLFSEMIGASIELNGVTANPQKLNVNVRMLALILITPLITVWFVLELICERESFKKTLVSLKKYRNLLWDLVSRDVKTKYRRSVLGVLWSVLNPLLMMLVLTAIFKNIFRVEIENFPAYYLTGYILFNFVSESTSFSMTSILGAAGLIKKVYIPKILFPLQKCLFSLVNLGFSMIAAVIVFVILRVEPSWTMLLFWVPIVYLFVFSFGFSLILATLNTFFRDVGYLYGVLLTVWLYMTPIVYPLSILPGWMQGIIRLNPLYYYVEYFRALTLYGTLPSLSDNLICIAFSMIFLMLGVLVFQKNQNKFIFHI